MMRNFRCIGGQKLGLQGPLRIVLKSDGTEIEDDSVLLDVHGLCSGSDVVLILLQTDEQWNRRLTKPKPKDLHNKSLSGAEHLLSIISQHSSKLRNIIDPDFGLLEELLKRGLLNEESYANVRKGDTYFKKNDCLIRYMKLKTKEEELQGFLDALRVSDQSHVVNYLLANGEHLEMCYGHERPLDIEEMNRLRASSSFLLNNIVINEELLADLVASKCITPEHREHVMAQSTSIKTIVELMTILRRRSSASLQKFITALYRTHQTAAADVLSQPGVAVPVHINVTCVRPTRDLKVIEEDLAIRLTEFAKTLSEGTGNMERKRKHYEKIKNLWLEMEMNGICYLSSMRGNSVAVYLWCRSRNSMSYLYKMRKLGTLGILLEGTMELLVDEDDDDDDDDEKLSFSLKVVEHEWNLAECYFQVSERVSEFIKPSPFMQLPKELLEIILMKSLLSFYNSTWRQFPFTDFDPYGVMTCVCRSWQELITQRHWFKDTVKSHLAKYKIIQRNSVLDILPKELVEMILMRSLLSAVHIPWRNSFSSMPYKTIVMMISVCQQWRNLLSSRSWFASTLKSYMKSNKHIATLQALPSIFYQCLDVDFFFLYEMHSHGLLTEEQLLEIGSESDRQEQINCLYVDVFLKFDSKNYVKFLRVLQSTGQSHIFHYLKAKGAINPAEHDERPLTDDERNRIDRIQPRFTDFIPPDEFLGNLGSCDCITKNQVNVINSLPDNLKMPELLEIVRRRSYAALRQFAAHLRKIDQYADIAEILTKDATCAKDDECEQLETSQMAFEKSSEEYDLKTIEYAFAERLLKIGRHIESGGTVTIQDLNEIRSFWMLLERFQPVPDSAEALVDTCRDFNISEPDDSPDRLMTDYSDDDDNATHLQGIQDECSDIYALYDSMKTSYLKCDDTCNYQNLSKLKKSQSYTCRRQIYREFLNSLFKSLIEFYQSQGLREENEAKSHGMKVNDMKTNAGIEMEGTSGLNFQIQLKPTVWKEFQHVAKSIMPEEFIQKLTDIAEVIYKRSKSVENIFLSD